MSYMNSNYSNMKHDNIFCKNYCDSIYSKCYEEEEHKKSMSIYSELDIDIEIDIEIENDEKRKREEKVISDIIDFYANEAEISELIPLPISPENFQKLKNQWSKENKFSMSVNNKKKDKSIPLWKKFSDSFKKESFPKRSLYDILTK